MVNKNAFCLNYIETAKNDTDFQRRVTERDGYVCQVCGKDYNHECYFNEKGINQMVCAHHHFSKGAFPELRLKIDNGITVCNANACHNKIHMSLVRVVIIDYGYQITPQDGEPRYLYLQA